MSVRKAALIAVAALLLSTFGVPIAEFVIMPGLIDAANIDQTVRNITAHRALFVAASFAYLSAFVGDVIVAWALFYLLRPISTPLAALTAAFRVVQAVVSIGAALNLFTAHRLLASQAFLDLGTDHVNAQVLVLLRSFSYQWGLALVIFGIHLILLGYLVVRSDYIPRLVGLALAVAGGGYVVHNLQPYLYPDVEIGFVFAALAGELVFVVWLGVWGWRSRGPGVAATPTSP